METDTSNRDRPHDSLNNYPPADPIDFPEITYYSGERSSVKCYIPSQNGETIETLNDVLRPVASDGIPEFAYYHPSEKSAFETKTGTVKICHVLRLRDRLVSNEGEEGIYEFIDLKVAIKEHLYERIEQLRNIGHCENALNEISAMQLLQAEQGNLQNLMVCLQVIWDGEKLYVVMQYYDGGDMCDVMHTRRGLMFLQSSPSFLPEQEARQYFQQALNGLSFLHSRFGICHKDISLENIFLDKNGNAVLADFGMCLKMPFEVLCVKEEDGTITETSLGFQDLQSAQETVMNARNNGVDMRHRRCMMTPQGQCGKFPYMAPEICLNLPFDGEATDVWCLGVTLLVMLTGKLAYERPEHSDSNFNQLVAHFSDYLERKKVQLSPNCMDLLKSMLQVQPRLRLTLQEIKNHPWVQVG